MLNRRSFLKYLGLGTGTMAVTTLPQIVPKLLQDKTQTKNRPIMEHGFYGMFQGKVTSLMFEKSDGVVSFWGNGVCLRLAPELHTERKSVFAVEYNFDLHHTRRERTPVLHLVLSELGQIGIPEGFELGAEEVKQLLDSHGATLLSAELIEGQSSEKTVNV
jgi:hypothetical protein